MLSGAVNSEQQQGETFCLATAGADDLLQRFLEIDDPALQQPVLFTKEKILIRHFEEAHTRD